MPTPCWFLSRLAICSLGLFLVASHGFVGLKIISVYLTWHLRSDIKADGLRFWRDKFDQSFAIYDLNQTSAAEPSYKELVLTGPERHIYSDLVPPILHHILIGMNWTTAPASWHEARNNCLAFHPSYETHFWDDQKATGFLKQHYPWFLDTWLNYRYVIQRADSLRYFVLHHYGGIFLDLDLSCKRSLGPLRRFSATAIAAKPVGISNGFIMASPGHPLFTQLIHALPRYNLNWGHSYVTVMWSTGPMFLSTEVMYQQARTSMNRLRVLDRRFHRLSGVVHTPLFDHLGASSWHQSDTIALKQAFRHLSSQVILFTFSACLLVAAALLCIWIWKRQRRAKADLKNQKAAVAVAIIQIDCQSPELEALLAGSNSNYHDV